MQCINVYKKYRPGPDQVDIFYVVKKFMRIYVDIKIYRPGHDVYVNFMFLHKRVYYMYMRLCEFRQAPNTYIINLRHNFRIRNQLEFTSYSDSNIILVKILRHSNKTTYHELI